MYRKNSKIVGVLAAVLLLLSACVKDPPKPNPPKVADSAQRVYIVCEGSLGNGNSGLGLYLPGQLVVHEDVFTATNSQPLGDVLQSITKIDERYFLCVNNSDKITVIDKDNHTLLGTISVPKPRYILPVSTTKAYVSSLFHDQLYIINPQTMTLTGSIALPAKNAENMLLVNGEAWVCTWDTAVNTLVKIDLATDRVSGSITIPNRAPQDIVADKDGNIWVLSGNVVKGKQAALTQLNQQGQILKHFAFATGADPLRLVMNKAGDMLYFIEVNYNGGTANNGIFRMGIYDTQLPSQPLIAAGQFQYYWALGIDPLTDDIYIGDPKGFTQKGVIQIYDKNGNAKTSFSSGIGPGHFLFD